MSASDPLQTLGYADILAGMNWHVGKSLRAISLGLASSLASTSALACEIEPWLFQLPGESEQDTRDRSDSILRDQRAVRQFAREDFNLKNAQAIYIARVLANNRGQGSSARPASTIEPISAVSGKLPTGPRTLRETKEQACSSWGDGFGDGEGTGAPVGTLVVVFEGLPKSEERPNGVDSLRATSVRHRELLELLTKYGKELDY